MVDITCKPGCVTNAAQPLPDLPAGPVQLGESCDVPMFVQICAPDPLAPQVEISDLALGCALNAAGDPIGIVVLSRTVDENTGAETAVRVMYPYSGAAPVVGYAGAFGTCGDAAVTSVIGCHNGAIPAVLHYVHATPGSPPVVIITSASGALIPGATGANTVPGACVIPDVPVQARILGGGINIASGTQTAAYDPDGNGASWSWNPSAGPILQSFTVTALRAGTPASGNTVIVRFGPTGSRVYLAQGQTFTWSVAQDDGNTAEIFDQEFRVDTVGNAAANIIWTEQA